MTFTDGKYCPNVTFADPRARLSLDHLKTTGATHVAIVVTWYSDTEKTTDIYPLEDSAFSEDGYFEFKTAKDEDLISIIEYAHKIGFVVMLKPHVDLAKVDRYL